MDEEKLNQTCDVFFRAILNLSYFSKMLLTTLAILLTYIVLITNGASSASDASSSVNTVAWLGPMAKLPFISSAFVLPALFALHMARGIFHEKSIHVICAKVAQASFFIGFFWFCGFCLYPTL